MLELEPEFVLENGYFFSFYNLINFLGQLDY